jgi:hypothetical protein
MNKKDEGLRRARLGDLRAIFRDRYGLALPNDDAGRDDLRELLLLASMAYNPERAMLSAIAEWAPWLMVNGELTGEAVGMIDDVNRTPTYLRKRTARQMANIMRLSDLDRTRLGITTIKPFDMSDAALAKRRKAKDAVRKWHKRRAAKMKDRKAWLVNCNTRTEPWKKRKMSKRSWYRWQAKERVKQRTKMARVVGTGVSATKFNTGKDRLVPLESQQRGLSRKRLARGRDLNGKREQVERKAARG